MLLSWPDVPDVRPWVARVDQHDTYEWLGGSMVQVLLGEEHTGGRLSVLRSTAPAGSASPVRVNATEDEIVVMLRGSAVHWVGEERYELSTGGVVLVPRGVPAAHRITADAEMVTVTTPAGLEAFYRAAGRDVRRPRPARWRVTFDALVRAAEATGRSILAAPLQVHEAIPADLLARPGVRQAPGPSGGRR